MKPNLFISYSWTNPDHEAWVVKLAEELVSQGIDVVFDKYDLKEGNDAIAFMESMVSNPNITGVVMICDKVYAEKSNSRTGGAGTEAQILTPELYKKKDQNKYVAIVRERDEDGNPYLPVYYGSKIYIDLSNEDRYAGEFERLLRWAWNKPLYKKPELGERPAFLAEDQNAIKLTTSVPFRRALDAVRNNKEYAIAAVKEYYENFAKEVEKFRIKNENDREFDDKFVESIQNFLPYRNELIELLLVIGTYSKTEEYIEATHRFLEKLIPYMSRPEHIMGYNDVDFDNFKFIVSELYLYAVAAMIAKERYDFAAYLINNPYYIGSNPNGGGETMTSFLVFREYIKTLAYRNQRLELNRTSLHSDFLKNRNAGVGIEYKHLMTADFILYLRGSMIDGFGWYPHTLLYMSDYGQNFEVFSRAMSVRFFSRIKVLLGVNSIDELDQVLKNIEARPGDIPRWTFKRVIARSLAQFDKIGTIE